MALSGFFFPVTEWHSFFCLFPLAFLLLIFNRKELFFFPLKNVLTKASPAGLTRTS